MLCLTIPCKTPSCNISPCTPYPTCNRARNSGGHEIKVCCVEGPVVGCVQGMRRWPRCREASAGAWRCAVCCSSSPTSCCWMCAAPQPRAPDISAVAGFVPGPPPCHMHKRAVNDAPGLGLAFLRHILRTMSLAAGCSSLKRDCRYLSRLPGCSTLATRGSTVGGF